MLKLTRAELYAAVWAEPLIALAVKYGVTGTGLKKICDRADVPTPPRGYWQKLEHGKPTKQEPLPVPAAASEIVRFAGYAGGQSPARVLQNKRVAIAQHVVETTSAASSPGAPAQAAEPARHAVGARHEKALRRAKPDADGMISIAGQNLMPMSIAPGPIDRAVSLLIRLFDGAARLGWSTAPSADGLRIKADGEPLKVRLAEKTTRAPLPRWR